MIASSRRRNCNRVRSVQMLRRIEASLCLRLVIYCNPCHNWHRCRQVAILPLFWDVNRVEANWHLKRMVSCNNLLHLLSPSSGSYLRGTSPIAMNIAQRRRIEMLAWSTHSLRPVLEKKVRINTGTMFQYLLHGLLRLTDRKSMSCQAPKNFIHRRDEIKQSTFLRLWMQKAPVPGGG